MALHREPFQLIIDHDQSKLLRTGSMNGGLADCSEIEIKMLSRSFAVAVTLPALATASVNVVLPCMQNYSLAVTPELASSPPACSWSDYDAFVTDAGVGWSDDATQRVQIGSDGKTNALSEALLTSSLTTALTIVEILRTTLGADYASRTAPVTIDVIGWAFHWTERAEVEGTSNTVEVSVWDTELQRDTRRFWGARIGGALRRMLPLVESVTVRGYGPEAPRVERTPLRDDGWLSLELYPGVYDRLSEPAPTLTLLENSGMHDDLWPSDGGCVSDKGELDVMSKAELEGRKAAGNTEGVGLGCMWRDTIELLRDSGRLVHATSYSSHEHMLAVENLRAIGADIVEAYPNGFREEGNRVLHMDLLRQEGTRSPSRSTTHGRGHGAPRRRSTPRRRPSGAIGSRRSAMRTRCARRATATCSASAGCRRRARLRTRRRSPGRSTTSCGTPPTRLPPSGRACRSRLSRPASCHRCRRARRRSCGKCHG